MPEIIIGSVRREATAQEITQNAVEPTPPPTSSELDALAAAVTEQELENNLRMKALGLVMADIIQQAFGVSQNVARNQVKTRFPKCPRTAGI